MAQVMTDYTIGVDPKQVFLQSVALQRAEAERRTALERKRNMETDLQSLMAAPSPDAFAQFYLKYPEAKEQVDAYRKTITEADNRTIVDTAQEAFMLNRAGKPQEVLNTFDVRIEALRNAGKPELANAAMRARRMYEIAPDQQSRESVLAMTLYNYGGGEMLEKVFGAGDLTGFQKDLIAGGIDPKSEEGRLKSRQYVQNKADPWIETEVINPAGQRVMFKGPQSVYMQNYGAKPSTSTAPKVGEIRGNYRYGGGDPSDRNNWIKIEGGQTAQPSGTFQGK